MIASDHDFSEEHKAKAKQLRLTIWCNIAICQDKLGEWADAVRSCNEALSLDPDCIKALFRRGCVHSASGEFARAREDLTAALRVRGNRIGHARSNMWVNLSHAWL